MRRRPVGYLFILPAGLLLAVFLYFPLAYSFMISFTRWDLSATRTFIGLDNYRAIIASSEFWNSVLYTFYYVLGVLPFSLAIGLGVALLLRDSNMKGVGFFRMIYFMPVVTSPIAAAMGFSWIFNTQLGYANYVIESMGGEPVNWLTNYNGIFQLLFERFGIQLPHILQGPSVALTVIILLGIWQNIGYATVVYLAGLQGIPQAFYEAARIDGASPSKILRKITLPLLSPTTFFLLIVFAILSFQVFGPVQVMTPQGGPLQTTSVIVFRLYQQAFSYYRFGYASAMAFLAFSMILLITLFQMKFVERKVYYE
ncbi:MAG: Permease component of ABC-type sugar transporter [Thermotogales bacterium 46_20]|nr:MAG: Permease component of ABC-type sugar transporter [Thermotogales bacterium 46_20]